MPHESEVRLTKNIHIQISASLRAKKNLKDVLRDIERDILIAAIKASQGNRAIAARRLGISRSHLYRALGERLPGRGRSDK